MIKWWQEKISIGLDQVNLSYYVDEMWQEKASIVLDKENICYYDDEM